MLIQLRERVNKLEILFLEFRDVQTEIETIVEDETINEQYEVRASFEENYYDLLSNGKHILEKHENDNKSNSGSSNRSRTFAQISCKAIHEKGNDIDGVKLPTIPLSKFQGSSEFWLEFRDTFQSLIYDSNNLSDIQKFHYLRAALEGNATQVIKSAQLSTSGCTIAWQTLCERYDDFKLLVHNHVQAIFALKAIQKESSLKIRRLLDELRKHLRLLNQLGENTENWDTLLIKSTR